VIKAFIGTVLAALYFRDAQTLKDRRSHLRSLEAKLRKAGLCTAQIGPADFIKRAWVTAVCVSGSERMAEELLESAIRMIRDPSWEVTLLEAEMMELEASEDL
jgi:uncharacterized protein YlxP (DUF503 family)